MEVRPQPRVPRTPSTSHLPGQLPLGGETSPVLASLSPQHGCCEQPASRPLASAPMTSAQSWMIQGAAFLQGTSQPDASARSSWRGGSLGSPQPEAGLISVRTSPCEWPLSLPH